MNDIVYLFYQHHNEWYCIFIFPALSGIYSFSTNHFLSSVLPFLAFAFTAVGIIILLLSQYFIYKARRLAIEENNRVLPEVSLI